MKKPERKPLFPKLAEIIDRNEETVDHLRRRTLKFGLGIIFFFALIIYRLYDLQIGHGEEFARKAFSNRVRLRKLAAPRGQILDRNGEEIVTNRPSFNVVLMREDAVDPETLVKDLAPVLHEEVSEIWERFREAADAPQHMPVLLKQDIDWRTLAYIESHNKQLPGVEIQVQPVRVYAYGNLMSHLIGYLGIINKEELAQLSEEERRFASGDLIGKRGLERLREKDLRGEKGEAQTVVDSHGFVQRRDKIKEPFPGKDIYLTLDAHIQRMVEDMMKAGDMSGAAVAMEVNTGRILLSVSSPELPLDQFVGGISKANWQALQDNPKHPQMNKVAQGTYPPGSTYKMITALAGLASGMITKDTTIHCPGYYRFGNRTYRCWKHSGHGIVDLRRAVAESCDTYFYMVGQKVGVDRLAEFANKMGLGILSGIEMENEKAGTIPSKAWKLRTRKEKWHDGETLSVAIGQGYNTVTPLQICLMTATLATDGVRMKPMLIDKIVDIRTGQVRNFPPQVAERIPLNSDYMQMIRQGMMDVVQGPRGTARKVAIKGLNIAGKTGTAQAVNMSKYKGIAEKNIPYKYRDHAWFTCYAPAEKPEIAVTVMIEHGLHGGSAAGPIARAILRAYFKDRLPPEKGDKTAMETMPPPEDGAPVEGD
ncbi:MAG: penicillin-binding protein 2 [Desulfobulbaceae bacterium]|jgi:penicillin-binding protein 2|nr:penicillin-binding protein 2 [Desulfobulbaceae bacterium]